MEALGFKTARKAQYLVLELALPGRPKANAGVILLDPASDMLHIKLRREWGRFAEPDDAEVLERPAAVLRHQEHRGVMRREQLRPLGGAPCRPRNRRRRRRR